MPARHKVVMHTHTRAGMAVCALKEGLLPISMVATAFHGKLAYHDYEGPSLDLDERGRLLKNLGDNPAMMLRNHGLLTTGRTVPEAFLRLYRLERACQIQVDAAAAGTLNIMGDNLAGKSGADLDRFAELGHRPGRPRIRRPDPQARQGRHELAALELPLGPSARAACKVAQRAAGRLDVGDAPAGLGLDQVEGDPRGLAVIVESDLAGRLRSVGLDRYGEVLDLPVLGIEEGIAVELGDLAAPLGLPHVGVDGARQLRHEEAVDLPKGCP